MQLSPPLSDRDIGDASEIDDRPRKRRRTLDYAPTCQQIALEEIDLEISLRQRIADVVQSRLAWAQLLQQSLQGSLPNGSSDIRTASLDALEAMEEPCKLIFRHESRLAPPSSRLQPVLPVPVPSPIDIDQAPRTNSRSTRTGGRIKPPPAPRKRLLFLRNSTTNPPEIAKLVCFVCQRSDFSSLQGLLNHCRLSHQLEVGSHDECVQSCAVLVPEEERELVISTGIELKGISLPSLRRLFELAVGAGDNVQLPPLPAKSQPPTVKVETTEQLPNPQPEAAAEDSPQDEVVEQGSHVTRTLGYHIDTPALAPFLGRAPKNRCINVATEQDKEVDIEDFSAGSGLCSRNKWRKPHVHRNVARKELDEIVSLSNLPADPAPSAHNQAAHSDGDSGGQQVPGIRMPSGTRFHIAARVQVADYSLFIPPNRRSPARPDHTHRWRLAVTSPSYSLPISTVLSKVTVASVTDPPPSTLAEPIDIDEPPFIVTSTTDRPFLARLTFVWAGPMNPPTEVDHWVELDPMQHASAVLGDDQVFDVELDRHTELLPVREDVRKVSWENAYIPETAHTEKAVEEDEEPEPDYALKLRSLLPQYPMTMKDTKGRFNARLPYTLVSTPAQLRNLHYGRRKAIEMGRARALRDAYTELVAQSHDEEALPLTAVDVFHWLEDESLFLRASVPTSGTTHQQRHKSSKSSRKPFASDDPRSTDYCRACGLQRAYHPTLPEDDKTLDVKNPLLIPASTPSACLTFHDDEPARLPVVEAQALLAKHEPDRAGPAPNGFSPSIYTPRPNPPSNNIVSLSTADLVAAADPRLVVAISRLTGLPSSLLPRTHAARVRPDADVSYEVSASSPEPDSTTAYPRTLTTGPAVGGLSAQPRASVEAELAPSAALAIALKAFVRQLVARGVEVFRQDEAALRTASGRHRHERARRVMAGGPARLLTPTHVLAGVSRHAATDLTSGALFLSLARLVETSRQPSDSDAPSTSADSKRFVATRGIHLDHRDAGPGQMTALSGGIHASGDGMGGGVDAVRDTEWEPPDKAPEVRVKIEEREV